MLSWFSNCVMAIWPIITLFALTGNGTWGQVDQMFPPTF